MIKKLSTSDPYKSMCSDLYSLGIFDKVINGLLSITEKNDTDQTIIIERKFTNNSGIDISFGYYFIQCLNSPCEEEHLKHFRGSLETFVKRKTKCNYMEVEPIVIAPEYSDVVINFIDQYNRIQRRKPIKLFRYGE